MSKKTSNDNSKNANPTAYILFIPGGAMMGIIPAMVLSHIEKLTETPASQLFQVMDAVSAGSIIVSGVNTDDITAEDVATLFCTRGPELFPEIPNREMKMLIANGLHTKKEQIDPERIDSGILGYIDNQCDELKKKTPGPHEPKLEKIRKIALQRWITNNTYKSLHEACSELKNVYPEATETLDGIEAIFAMRKTNGHLSKTFKKSVLGGMDSLIHWVEKNTYYDEVIARQEFQQRYGNTRMEDCKTSVYISTYDAINNRAKTFFSRKKDLFDPAPDAERITSSENATLWDATMASTANPFAYPPHITEDKTLCIDKAIVHTPIYCVNDILANKPENTDVKLVILGTGKRLPPKQNLTEKDLQRLRQEYKNRGVAGNLLKGNEIAELESYTISAARQAIRKSLGDQNIIDISPRLYPENPHEVKQSDMIEELPNTNPLDASPENIRRIVKLAQKLINEEDEKIRKLSFMLVENLYNLGQMDRDKFERVAANIGIDPDTEKLDNKRPKQTSVLSRAFQKKNINDKNKGITGTLKNIFKGLFTTENIPDDAENDNRCNTDCPRADNDLTTHKNGKKSQNDRQGPSAGP